MAFKVFARRFTSSNLCEYIGMADDLAVDEILANADEGSAFYAEDTGEQYVKGISGWVKAYVLAKVGVVSFPGTAEADIAAMKSKVDTMQADIALIKAGIPITPGALVTSEAHIGETGGWSDLIKVTPTITVGAYSAQDMVGGKLTLSNAMRIVGGKGYLYSLEVIDTDKIAAALDIHLFSAMAGAYADNGAESISAADALNHLGLIRILAADYLTKANFSVAQPDPTTFKPIVLKSGAASRDLFAIVVCTGTPTYTHINGLQFNFGIIGD